MIEQIKEALERAAANGPWKAGTPAYIRYLVEELEKAKKEIEQLRYRDKVVSRASETLGRYVREGKEEIERLNAELKNALKENERLKAIDERECHIAVTIRDENIRLKAEHTAMKEALEFYGQSELSSYWNDNGVRARTVLSTLFQPKEGAI